MTAKDHKIKQVLNWRKSGFTFREIGERLNLSHERVRQIYISYKQKCLNKKKLIQIITKIKSQDGLNYYWPIDEFVTALDFDSVHGVLLSYFERFGYKEISFQEFIDIFLPTERSYFGRRLYDLPLYRVGGIGLKRYATIVKRLNELDFGEPINTEIHERTLKIMRSTKIKKVKFSYEKKHPEIMKKLRSENGINIFWPINEFVLSIGFGKVNHALSQNIIGNSSGEINITQFLDIFIPVNTNIEEGLWRSIPSFRFRNIEIKKFSFVVNRLLELDLGDKINQEIRDRISNLIKRFGNKGLLKQINLEDVQKQKLIVKS